MSEYFGKDVQKLGFGLMRLPKKGEEIDIEQVKQMVDMFLEAGFTYFDTAFVYQGSEEAAKKALVERHPRESYTLATKINDMASGSENAEKEQFATSLERTGAGYFDFYLLHALMEDNYKKYDEYHLWEFAREQKEKGLIRHLGFSFHGGPQLLDQLLKEHPEVEFVQLQINYADWENPSDIPSQAPLPTPAFLHPLPLLPLSDRHPHFIPRLLADLKTDILAQADYITDAAVLISDSHIDHAAVIRLAVKCGMYLHSSSAEFLPDIIRKTHVSAALPVRFTDQGFIFIHFSVHLPYLLLAAHIRRTIYAV